MKYTVQKGDTLMNIVRTHYGHEKDWREVWKQNRKMVKDPNQIYPGQELDLPDSLFDIGDWIRSLLK